MRGIRGSWGTNALLVAVAVVTAVLSGTTVHELLDPGGPGGPGRPGAAGGPGSAPGVTATPTTSAGGSASATSPVSTSPAAGAVPGDYVGGWTARYEAAGASHWRNLNISTGIAGDVVMDLSGSGPGYQCSWRAELTAPGPPLRLGPSQVVRSQSEEGCSPGGATTLELLGDGDRLRRVFDAGDSAAVTYTRVGGD